MSTRVDYKKELENAAKSMILVHDPHLLIKMIVRMIVNKVQVSHAGILLYDMHRDSYVLTVSGGTSGLKIPAGFARIDIDSPLIQFFRKRMDKQFFKDGALVLDKAKNALLRADVKHKDAILLKKSLQQMEIFGSTVCIPSYFRDTLLGMLLLGEKKDEEPFTQEELGFLSALASDVAMAIRNAQLFAELEHELDKKKRLFINTTVALAAAIDAKDHYTHGHTSRVTRISIEIARKLSETGKQQFSPKFLEELHIASLLHDIGKIGIPESILNKEGPLNDTERKRMQEHPIVGVSILEPIKELEHSILGVKHHHEWYDGTGYPDGLRKGKIPMIAAIISVADAYDAMTTDRPYRKGLSREEAVAEIKSLSGRQFHPQVARALIALAKENKI